MALFEGKTPAERNKMIAAIALPILALVFVYYMFSGPSKPAATTNVNNSNRRPGGARSTTARQQAPGSAEAELSSSAADILPINCCPEPYSSGEAGRNIFAFYVKPPPPPTPVPTVEVAQPTPTPDKMLAGLMPQSVFARTAGFTIQLNGDRFAPGDRVYVNGQELPTEYKSPQQLSANVPAALISTPGARQIKVQTPDGSLYSNEATLNVMQPPAPTYTYIGFLKRARPNNNTAVLKDAKGELYSVRQGDLVEGRFRVTDISDRGVEVVDKDLNVKHTMPFVDTRGASGLSGPGRVPGSIQPPPPSEEGDEEP